MEGLMEVYVRLLVLSLFLAFAGNAFAETLSLKTIQELKKYGPILDCSKKYSAGPNQAGNGPGKVTMELKLDKDGRVVSVEENSKLSTIHEDILRSCLIQALKQLKFGNEAKGSVKTLLLPLDFPILGN